MTRERIYFGSAKQIEDYFAERLTDMSYGEAKRYLQAWCKDHKAVCSSEEYTADDILRLCVDPWDPVRNLPYIGW